MDELPEKEKKKRDKEKEKEEEKEAAADGRRASVMQLQDLATLPPMVRRRLAMDNQQDLQTWMQHANIKEALTSNFLENLNQKMIQPTKCACPLMTTDDTSTRR